jgi:MFS family permease
MRKNVTMVIACVATVFASVAASAYAPGETQMRAKWGLSQVAIATGITAFTTGFALAPMVIAPISEVRGRRPVFLVMGVLYVVCTIGCAATESFGG